MGKSLKSYARSFAKKRPVIALIAAVLIIVAVLILPKLTGKTLGELVGGIFGQQEQISQTESAAEAVSQTQTQSGPEGSGTDRINENGEYTSKDEVALYIRTYGKLPKNFITKSQAESLGWEGGPLWDYAPGKSIGGDVFSNREGLLPKKSGRTWYECDIDYDGGSRGAKRIVFSSDGLIYYTDDHYESFTQLY